MVHVTEPGTGPTHPVPSAWRVASPLTAVLPWALLLLVSVVLVETAALLGGRSVAEAIGVADAFFRTGSGLAVVAATYYLSVSFLLTFSSPKGSRPRLATGLRQTLLAMLIGLSLALATWALGLSVLNHGLTAGSPFAVQLCVFALLGPLTEELYFRGTLMAWLRIRIPDVPAQVVNSVLFSLVHLRFLHQPYLTGWLDSAVLFLLGMIASNLTLKTQTIGGAFALHATYNACVLLLGLTWT